MGSDNVVLGNAEDSPKLTNQIVAAMASADYKPFLGLFGLSNYSSSVRDSGIKDPTALQSLRNSNSISGHYYGYTAGASYRQNPPQWASLTMGGYDALRVGAESDRLTVPLGQDSTLDLLVNLRSIRIGVGSASQDVGGLGISVNINSLIPEIWLPETACTGFEDAFGLQWNDTAEYYTVNETQHQRMVEQNKTVTFSLAANQSSTAVLPIQLPYAAFDLQLKWPLANITDDTTSIRYFPLKRASSELEYTLGRTFLQEAWVTIDLVCILEDRLTNVTQIPCC